ncbi:MAG: hypothetical protein JW862_10735 [Anaerolineales bacterium]|nr:hypothetical protein [Anaerolineales bacterium]
MKRPQLYLLLGAAAGAVFVHLVTRAVIALAVLEFAYLTVLFGLAPAFFFRRVLRLRNFLGWLLYAGVLGILLIPFTFLFLGWLRFNWVFEHSILFLYLCSAAGLLALLAAPATEIRPYWNFNGLRPGDWFLLLVLALLTAGLTLHNFNEIRISWDTFTFWGLDARYIFEQNQLGTAAYHRDLMIHRYTSFYPLYHAIIFDLYGGVFEQYAAWINVYINLLALLLVYWQVLPKSWTQKLGVTAALLVTASVAAANVYLFSMYSDVLCAFLLLVYYVILLAGEDLTPADYGRRVFLLLLLALSFYFVKSPFLYFTILLTFTWLLYDGRFLLRHYRQLAGQAAFWLALLIPLAFWLLRENYFAGIPASPAEEGTNASFLLDFRVGSLKASVDYALRLVQFMISEAPFLLGLWWLALLSALFVKQAEKRYLFVWLSALLIFLLPLGSYMARQYALESGSLLRYAAIVMYLFPWVLGFVDFQAGNFSRLVAVLVFLLVASYVFLNTFWSLPLAERFVLTDGSYASVMGKYQQYAADVVARAGLQARILIADDMPEGAVNNMTVPAIFIRYYMPSNSVGAQYQALPVEQLLDYARTSDADAILLLSYAGTLPGCDPLFTLEHDYLIQLGEAEPGAGACPFVSLPVLDLGPAVR